MRIGKRILLALIAGVVFCISCARQELKSRIVEKVEKAGAGNLLAVSSPGMRQWLGKHRQIAMEIESMCRPVRKAATAQWASSTEGRLCGASSELAFFRSAPARGDGRVFRPGVN